MNDKLTKYAITQRFLKAVEFVIYKKKRDCRSFTDVSKLINVNQQNFSRFRSGLQSPTITQIASLCFLFDIDPRYILLDQGQLEENPNDELLALKKKIQQIETQLKVKDA